MKVNQGPPKLESPLEEVVTWLKSKDRVQRCEVATSRGEVEVVRVSILCETSFASGFRELLFENRTMRGKPSEANRLDQASNGSAATCHLLALAELLMTP